MKPFLTVLAQHQEVLASLADINDEIEKAGQLLIDTLRNKGKILLCGNGGSAADCQHIAAEFVVRYEQSRKALAAVALTTDSSILTASANDFEYDAVFARQVEAIGNRNDCLIAISTSGKSQNVLNAVNVALDNGIKVIGLTGREGNGLATAADIAIKVPSNVTARIQEAHIVIGHWWCGLVEESFCREE